MKTTYQSLEKDFSGRWSDAVPREDDKLSGSAAAHVAWIAIAGMAALYVFNNLEMVHRSGNDMGRSRRNPRLLPRDELS
jgi:hypothetical protein